LLGALSVARRSPPRGFTLIEAMITLAVAAILLTLALPTWGDFAARHKLVAASETLAGDLALARHEAVQRGTPVYVVPQPGAAWCYAISTDPGCDCRTAGTVCALRVVDAGEHRGVELLAARSVRFEPVDGRSDGGVAATWRAGRRYAAEVRVHPLGRARVCSTAAPLRGVPACGT
jgi:type IV fimbrial biogenesis protein FimT